jgi:multicomponent Na+:H+ antiporter subunit G
MMRDVLTIFLLFSGAMFCLLGAVGITRMPDLFTRLQASTKAGTLGVGFIMVGAAVHFAELGVTVRSVMVIAFLFLTAPVAAHMIARAAYFVKVPLWKNTELDELEGKYDTHQHTVASPDEDDRHHRTPPSSRLPGQQP